MEKAEKRWLYVLIIVFVIVNVVTLSSLIPWQSWQLWQNPEPAQVVKVAYNDYTITMDTRKIKACSCAFSRPSADVTYGFGVFREDNSNVFQMQVLPAGEPIILKSMTGTFDVRPQNSRPKHSDMVRARRVV